MKVGLAGETPTVTSTPHPLPSNMSYMELKKRHQDLASEVQVLGQRSKEVEDQHLTEVKRLAEEIRHYKVR